MLKMGIGRVLLDCRLALLSSIAVKEQDAAGVFPSIFEKTASLTSRDEPGLESPALLSMNLATAQENEFLDRPALKMSSRVAYEATWTQQAGLNITSNDLTKNSQIESNILSQARRHLSLLPQCEQMLCIVMHYGLC